VEHGDANGKKIGTGRRGYWYLCIRTQYVRVYLRKVFRLLGIHVETNGRCDEDGCREMGEERRNVKVVGVSEVSVLLLCLSPSPIRALINFT
jgi:hypothetical protein